MTEKLKTFGERVARKIITEFEADFISSRAFDFKLLASLIDQEVQRQQEEKKESAKAETPCTQGLSSEETGRPAGGWLNDLIALYETPRAVCLWLTTENQAIKGQRPIDLVLNSAEDEKLVARIVDQLASGAYL